MFIIGAAILGLFTMLLWNAIIPDVFHGPTLTYLQSVGLLVLSRILVGIRGGRHGWRMWKRWGRHQHWGGPKHHWKYDINIGGPQCGEEWWQKFAGMSPEERERIQQKWKASKAEWKDEFKRQFKNPPDVKPGDEIHPS